MKTITPVVIAALLAVGISPHAGALDFCVESIPIDIGEGDGSYHAFVDPTWSHPNKGYVLSVWVYEETNSRPGIQADPAAGDPCADPSETDPDTVVVGQAL